MSSRSILLTALTLLGLAVSYLFSLTDVGSRADYFFYDRFVNLRASSPARPPMDPRLLILEIDEKSRQRIALPLALWLPLYAQISESALSSGAELVVFDLIPSYAPKELLLPFAKVVLAHPDQVKMASFFDLENSLEVAPADGIRALVGDHNIGIVNLLRDPDGIFRRQFLQNSVFQETARAPLSRLVVESLAPDKSLDSEVWVNFVGPPGTFPRVSFSDVLSWAENGNKAKLKEVFQGKTVLIGATARVDQDFVETPFDLTRPMPGVELHANIINTLLLEQEIVIRRYWILLVPLLVLISWVALDHSISRSSLLFAGLTLSWLVWGYWQLTKNVLILPLGTALVGCTVSFLAAYLYRYYTVEQEKRRIRSVFARYVSPEVMNAMLEVPEDHKPELAKKQRVTVMFSDINDFSTACETLEPQEVTRRLNIYFDEMAKIIYQHQGTIIRFIGDDFMVLFGAPRTVENAEEMAVRAALKMVERLEEMKSADPSGSGFYEVKIGIHVGDMILTSIGNEIRSDYNCIGDSTNMAARVLSLTKPLKAKILLSEEVRKMADSADLTYKDLGVHPVKGRAGEVHVYEAMMADCPSSPR